jgi:hypothetical protein
VSRFLTAFLAEGEKGDFSGGLVPNKSEKAKTPNASGKGGLAAASEPEFSPYSPYSGPSPRKNALFEGASLPHVAPEAPADVAADRVAVAADVWTPDRPAPHPTNPPADMVEALAEALARTPGQRITDPVKAMEYFRSEARRRLAMTNDPMARGLLLGFERQRG